MPKSKFVPIIKNKNPIIKTKSSINKKKETTTERKQSIAKNIGKTKGALDLVIDSLGGDEYFDSDKIMIIAPSGSGKSVLAMNLALTKVKNFNNIVIISPSDDPNLNFLCNQAKEIGMNCINKELDENGNLVLPDDIEKTLFIIDDYYAQNQMERMITKLISVLNTRGRHSHNSIIYICHSDRNIPDVIKRQCNSLYINQPYPKRIPKSEIIPENNDKHQFWELDSYENPTFCRPFYIEDLTLPKLKMLLNTKIFREDSKKRKLPGLKVLLAESKAGNTAAKDVLKDTVKSQKKMKLNSKEDTQNISFQNPPSNYKQRVAAVTGGKIDKIYYSTSFF